MIEHYRVRKWFALVDTTVHEGGDPASQPLVKAVAAVVIENPFAGGFATDLSRLLVPSPSLGTALGTRATALLGGLPAQSYGKGGIAGVNGEQEHVVACITTPFGDALREAVGGGKAWISSATKTASAGETLDIPLAHKDALFVRSHYDAISFRIPDAPRPDELIIAIAVSSGARVHERVGGLEASEAVGDGLH